MLLWKDPKHNLYMTIQEYWEKTRFKLDFKHKSCSKIVIFWQNKTKLVCFCEGKTHGGVFPSIHQNHVIFSFTQYSLVKKNMCKEK